MNRLNHLVEKCYKTENMLCNAVSMAKNTHLKNLMNNSSLLFKNLGDRIFLANVSEGGKTFFEYDQSKEVAEQWVDEASFRADSGHFSYYETTVNLHQSAIREIRAILQELDLSDDITKVLKRGIEELLENVQDLSTRN